MLTIRPHSPFCPFTQEANIAALTKTSPRFFLGLLLILALSTANSQAATVITDSFNSATAGTALHGRTTETGNVEWHAGNYYGLTASGTVDYGTVHSGTANSRFAVVPITVATGDLLTMSAQLRAPSENTVYWSALTFCKNATSADSAFWDSSVGQVTLHLDYAGHWWVYGAGQTPVLDSGTISGFTGGDYHTLKLIYNTTTMKVTASVDSTDLVTDLAIGYTPTITYAGFQFYGTAAGASADNFSLIVPEPASLLLLAMGGIVLASRRHHR